MTTRRTPQLGKRSRNLEGYETRFPRQNFMSSKRPPFEDKTRIARQKEVDRVFDLDRLPAIPFNKPFAVGNELSYIARAVSNGNIGGDGEFTKSCSRFLEDRFKIPKVLLTPSCTAALEIAAMLCELGPGDEVIMPSYTFVSTANAVARLGARPVFVDIRPDTLNIDETLIEAAITKSTKAIFPVHYAGVGCRMDPILDVARKYDLRVVEDAAQGVNAFHDGRALGSIGHMGAFSFHETKNVICGEGGALCISDPTLLERAEILRDKGTNRKQFFPNCSRLQAKLNAQQAELEAQARRLAALEAMVAKLQEQLAAARKNSATSSKPPSSDIVKPPKPPLPDGQTQRKIGGQPGHPKHERDPFPSEAINAGSFDWYIDLCPQCGHGLEPAAWASSV